MIIIIGIGSGIGRHLFDHFIEQGETVKAGSRSINNKINDGVTLEPIDVCNEASVAKFFELKDSDSIKGLVYSAGITIPPSDLTAFDRDKFMDVLDTNVIGFATVMKHALPHMADKGARIVAIGSMACRSPSLYSGFEYTSSKHALAGVVRHLARDLAQKNILVNCVHPGPVDTPMLRTYKCEQDILEIEKNIPTHKLTTMSDIVSAVSFLLSPQNMNITGAGIDVNGGQVTTC
jgi:NAD(P)-dependent dehydrogenase (short-subunit alcohol dehydrogenase family)